MNDVVNQLTSPSLMDIVVRVGIALVVLLVGYLLALLFASLVRRILGRTSIDKRLADKMGPEKKQISVEQISSQIVFWLIILATVISVFYVLNLVVIASSLNVILEDLMAVIPSLLGAGLLALIAWGVATFLRFVVIKALGLFNFDDKMADEVGLSEGTRPPLGESLGSIVYWFVWLLFLPAILDVLGLDGLLEPVNSMIVIFLGYLPNIVGAALIVLFGWAVAQVVRKITVNFLAAIGTDSVGERVGIKPDVTGGMSLSQIVGLIVYILILVPVLVAGLQALQIEAISGPATRMLTAFFDAVPVIIGAVLIIAISYFVAKLVANLVTTLLTSIGFNKVLGYIGLGGDAVNAKLTPAELVGYLTLVAIMLFATVEAANMLGFGMVGLLVVQFIEFFFQVVLALIVMGLGMFAANLAYKIVVSTAGSNAHVLGQLSRVVIIVFAGAIALFTLGIAEDIVNLAFGLVLLALAVAFGLAFGLGGREVAGRELELFVNKLHSADSGAGDEPAPVADAEA